MLSTASMSGQRGGKIDGAESTNLRFETGLSLAEFKIPDLDPRSDPSQALPRSKAGVNLWRVRVVVT